MTDGKHRIARTHTSEETIRSGPDCEPLRLHEEDGKGGDTPQGTQRRRWALRRNGWAVTNSTTETRCSSMSPTHAGGDEMCR
ncbi:MAG: hypothetical protein ACFCVK_13660 [Acidimicrobiales bacterium]